MWSRVIEIMLACWLAMSPFIFRHPGEATALWANDFGCAVAIVAFAALSYWPPARYAHLASVLIAGWLILFGYLGTGLPMPARQNELLFGLVLAMFALVPNRASVPTSAWRRFATHLPDREKQVPSEPEDASPANVAFPSKVD